MRVCCQLYNDCGNVYMLTEYNVLLWVCLVFHTFVMLVLSCDSYQSSACETIIDTAMPPSILSLAVAGLHGRGEGEEAGGGEREHSHDGRSP